MKNNKDWEWFRTQIEELPAVAEFEKPACEGCASHGFKNVSEFMSDLLQRLNIVEKCVFLDVIDPQDFSHRLHNYLVFMLDNIEEDSVITPVQKLDMLSITWFLMNHKPKLREGNLHPPID